MQSTPRPPGSLVLLRLSGEVSTKGRATRRQFVTRLVRNLEDALTAEGVPGTVERRHDRLFVHLPAGATAPALERVFGVQSLSPVEPGPGAKLDEVVEVGRRLFAPRVAGRRFAVRARMVGGRGRHAFGARDVEVALGECLREASGGVDLSDPETTCHVEVYQDRAYFFSARIPGPAGLPVGTESRALALVSGGFDSAVASWYLLRRGVALDYVFFNLGGATHRHGTLRVMKVVADHWSYGSRPRLHAVDFDEVSREIRAHAEPRYWQILLKRWMLRAADAVARESGARALVTGESVGQVSSQTLQNLAVIGEATTLPILRPLVGHNKEEIIARARAIGTAELSAVVAEYCALVPRRPATAARAAVVREQEARLDPRVLERALAGREGLDLRAADPDDSGLPELEVRAVPEGAILLDLRPRASFESWHAPGSVQLDFGHALEAFPSFAPDRTYVLSCEFGLKSAHLAEQMRRAGLRAFHFRGGTRALRRWVESRARATPGGS